MLDISSSFQKAFKYAPLLDARYIDCDTSVERLKDYLDGLTQLKKELENKGGLERQL